MPHFFSQNLPVALGRLPAPLPGSPPSSALILPPPSTSVPLCLRGETSCFSLSLIHPSSFILLPSSFPSLRVLRAFVVKHLFFIAVVGLYGTKRLPDTGEIGMMVRFKLYSKRPAFCGFFFD